MKKILFLLLITLQIDSFAQQNAQLAAIDNEKTKTFANLEYIMAADEQVYIKTVNGEIVNGFCAGFSAESVLKYSIQNFSSILYSNEKSRKGRKELVLKFTEIDEIYLPVKSTVKNGPSENVVNPYKLPSDKNNDFVYFKTMPVKTNKGEKIDVAMLVNASFDQKYRVFFVTNTLVKDGMPNRLYIQKGAEIEVISKDNYTDFFNSTFADCKKLSSVNEKLIQWKYFGEHSYRFNNDECN